MGSYGTLVQELSKPGENEECIVRGRERHDVIYIKDLL